MRLPAYASTGEQRSPSERAESALRLRDDGFRALKLRVDRTKLDEGLAAVDEGFAYAERSTERGFLAELHRVRGELLLVKGDEAAAEESLRTALDMSQQQQARGFELRAATALARLLVSSGRTPGAHAVLDPVYRWFDEGRGTADLAAARILLDGMDED